MFVLTATVLFALQRAGIETDSGQCEHAHRKVNKWIARPRNERTSPFLAFCRSVSQGGYELSKSQLVEHWHALDERRKYKFYKKFGGKRPSPVNICFRSDRELGAVGSLLTLEQFLAQTFCRSQQYSPTISPKWSTGKQCVYWPIPANR